MNRQELADLLVGSSQAFTLCRSALIGGAEFKVWSEATSTPSLVSIYSRRMRTIGRTGQPSIGLEDAVVDLRARVESELCLGYVDNRPGGGYYFQLFLNTDLTQVVACLGVRSSKGESQVID
jgi:hypothetical protein